MPESKPFQKLLQGELTAIRLKNPRYSMRSFAKKLGISPAALSHFLSGKKEPSKRLASRIVRQMNLEPAVGSKLLEQVERRKQPAAKFVRLDPDRFHLIAQWQHFAILSLAETADFRPEPGWIAKRLGISVPLARESIHRLVRIGLLRREGRQLLPTGESYTTPDGETDFALRKMNEQDLLMAGAALQNLPVHQRDFTAITMAIDPARIPEATRRIRAFQAKLCAWLESGDKSEVYKISTQLFPLTQLRDS